MSAVIFTTSNAENFATSASLQSVSYNGLTLTNLAYLNVYSKIYTINIRDLTIARAIYVDYYFRKINSITKGYVVIAKLIALLHERALFSFYNEDNSCYSIFLTMLPLKRASNIEVGSHIRIKDAFDFRVLSF